MARVTFIRHAQSLQNAGMGNVDNIQNCGLSDFGILQAKSLDLTFECIVLSPLRRAIQTYAYSQIKTGIITISDLFREFRVIGHPTNHLEKEQLVRETEGNLADRTKKAMEFLRNLPYTNIGVVTHHNFAVEFSKLVDKKSVYLKNCGTFSFNI